MQQDTTYALLIKVDQPGCKVYFSELGGSNLEITEQFLETH